MFMTVFTTAAAALSVAGLVSSKNHMRSLKKENEILESKITSYCEQVSQMDSSFNILSSEYAELRKKNEKLRDYEEELQSLRLQNQSMNDEIKKMEVQLQDTQNTFTNRLESLQNEKSKQEKKLNEDIRMLKNRNSDYESLQRSYLSELDRLRLELADAQKKQKKEVAPANDELLILANEKIRELEDENAQLRCGLEDPSFRSYDRDYYGQDRILTGTLSRAEKDFYTNNYSLY